MMSHVLDIPPHPERLFDLPGLSWLFEGQLCAWTDRLAVARSASRELLRQGHEWTQWGSQVTPGLSRLNYWKPQSGSEHLVSLIYLHTDGAPRWTIEVLDDKVWVPHMTGRTFADSQACQAQFRLVVAEWGYHHARIVPTLFWA